MLLCITLYPECKDSGENKTNWFPEGLDTKCFFTSNAPKNKERIETTEWNYKEFFYTEWFTKSFPCACIIYIFSFTSCYILLAWASMFMLIKMKNDSIFFALYCAPFLPCFTHVR